MASSRTRFFFSSSWRCFTTSTPVLMNVTLRCALNIHHLVIAMPSPRHGGAPLHANAPTLAKVTLRRAARVHRDARYASAPPPTGLARSLSTAPRTSFPWPQPSAIPPRAYPQRLVPRAPRATALGRPRQEPIHSTSRIVPTGHSPSAVPPGAYPRRLVPRVPDHTAISRPPGAYPQRLVPCAPGHHTLPAYGCDLSAP